MMSVLRARLLGGFKLTWGGDLLPPMPGVANRSLLAYLLTYRDRPHTRDLLASTFWPDLPDSLARRRLSQGLWQIRKAFKPNTILLSDGDTVQLNAELPIWLDVEEFAKHNAKGPHDGEDTITRSTQRIKHCQLCVDLYQGEFLAGYYDDWILTERERLRETFLAILAQLVESHKARREHERALRYAARLASEDPWREQAHREVMRFLHLQGRDKEALKQFETCRRVLNEDLAVEPSPETVALAREIANRTDKVVPPVLPEFALAGSFAQEASVAAGLDRHDLPDSHHTTS